MKLLIGLFVMLMGMGAQASECIPFDTLPACVQVDFTQGPVNRAESQFVARFFSTTTGEALHPQDLKVDLWMQMGHHGHGSSPVTVTPQADGSYLVTEVYFVMPGEWQVRFFAQDDQGTSRRAVIYVDVPRN